MKILILGHGQHGKDTVAELVSRTYGLKFASSSRFAFDRAVWPVMQHEYDSREACYEARRVRRLDWWRIIREYNTPDLARLQREMLAEFDIYVGLRDADEYEAGKHLYNRILWVDAFGRGKPSDPSMQIEFNRDDMVYIDNNRGREWLSRQVLRLGVTA